MVNTKKGTIQLLDCTLRDGGQGIESNMKNGIATCMYDEVEKKQIAQLVCDAKVDIVELGCITEQAHHKGCAIYPDLLSLSKMAPERVGAEQMLAGLFIDPDVPLAHVPDYSEEFVPGLRMILRYSQLKESLEFCKGLSAKGYRVFIQPMLTMRYTDKDIQMVMDYANEMNAEAVYIVDSFGYMSEDDVYCLYEKYADRLNQSIKIGFHAHNNMEQAFTNVKYFVEQCVDRDCIIDSCVLGMGQGAGNLQTEVATHYLNSKHGGNYEINPILNVCEMLEKYRPHDLEAWGYSALRFVPAMHKTAYKYAIALKMQYGMSLAQINDYLCDIPSEMRHRYTPENLEAIVGMKK